MNVSDLMNSKASEGKVEHRHKKAALATAIWLSIYEFVWYL